MLRDFGISSQPKTVLLCTGKSCRKKAKVQAEILANLDEDIGIQPVRCQDVCSGPVIGLKVRGRWEWFKKLRKAKDAHAVNRPFGATKSPTVSRNCT